MITQILNFNFKQKKKVLEKYLKHNELSPLNRDVKLWRDGQNITNQKLSVELTLLHHITYYIL